MAASRTRPTRISILLRLYPRDWQARYADELAALLEDTALTPAKVLDVVVCALDAHWSGDYPSAAGDDRKVRRPMVNRIAALLTAAGGIFFAAVMAISLVTSLPESGPVVLLGVPIAMAALALGILSLSLGSSVGDTIGRTLGLATSAFAIGITLAILYLFFIGDAGFDAAWLLFPGFALATGLLGLRLTLLRDRVAGVVLLTAGMIGSAASLLSALESAGPDQATALNFGIVTVAWGLVGLIRLRSPAAIAATA